MEGRLREMSRQQRRPWSFGDEEGEEEEEATTPQQEDDDKDIHEAIVRSVMEMSLREERARQQQTRAGLREEEASAVDQWISEPFSKRANEVLMETRDKPRAAAAARAAQAIKVVTATPAPEGSSSSDDEDEDLRRAIEMSRRDFQQKQSQSPRQRPAATASAVAAGAASSAAVGDDLALALQLSQDPAQQVNSDIQQLLQAVMESKRQQQLLPPALRPEEPSSSVQGSIIPGLSVEEQIQLDRLQAEEMLRGEIDTRAESEMLEKALERSKKEAVVRDLMAATKERQQLRRLPGSRRPVLIDGNNVAFEHGNHQKFSPYGILNCIEYFIRRGHQPDDITAFAFASPKGGMSDEEREAFVKLQDVGFVKTVSKKHYDDLILLKGAQENGGIVVSNDRFRDVAESHPEMVETIENCRLGYRFIQDQFTPFEDPLGREGPKLDDFLKF